jgi:hypothetical protein
MKVFILIWIVVIALALLADSRLKRSVLVAPRWVWLLVIAALGVCVYLVPE